MRRREEPTQASSRANPASRGAVSAVRPATIRIGSLHVRVKRGPDAEGRWYWQARHVAHGVRLSTSLGWLTAEAAERAGAALVATGLPGAPALREVWTWRDLCRAWGREQVKRHEAGAGADRSIHYHSLRAYEGAVARLVGKEGKANGADLGWVMLDRLAAADLDHYRRASGYAPGTVQLDMDIAAVIWTWGRKRGLAPDRNWPGVTTEPTPTIRRRPPRAKSPAVVVGEPEAPPAMPWANAEPRSARRPLAADNLVTLGEVMVECGIGRPAALQLVEGLPAVRLGRATRWRWADVLGRALDRQAEPEAPAPTYSSRPQEGDWC